MAMLRELLEVSSKTHSHLCPRQVLGVRMGMLAALELGLELPQTDKRLLTIVETDGCFADGVSAATGCHMGRRTMRLEDYGKIAATFIDTKTENAVRIAPKPNSRESAWDYAPDAQSRWQAQLEGYQVMPYDELLRVEHVSLNFDLARLIGKPGVRVSCEVCGEEIINGREVVHNGQSLCRGCQGNAYYHLATKGYATRDGV